MSDPLGMFVPFRVAYEIHFNVLCTTYKALTCISRINGTYGSVMWREGERGEKEFLRQLYIST
jgi:hypothetical protein